MVIESHHQLTHRFLQDIQDARASKDNSSHALREPEVRLKEVVHLMAIFDSHHPHRR
jgi:hypothetical protein